MQGGIINTLFALIFAVNLLAIMWGLVMYFVEIGSDEAKREYKGVIIGGITSLFLLMCVFAVVDWIRTGLGL